MIRFIWKNYSYCTIEGSSTELMNLWSQYSFYVPGYKFMPSFISGYFDGQIHLINLKEKTVPLGIINKIDEYCKEESIEVEYINFENYESPSFDDKKYDDFIKKYKFYSKKNEIIPREDQKESIIRALTMERCTNVCPTSFGKSLCIFIESLYYKENNKKVLLIVPTVDLVRQFEEDIRDYCTSPSGLLEEYFPNIQQIYAGHIKEIDDKTDIVISTWQSIYNMSEEWIQQFGAILLDECHKASAQCIKGIFDKAGSVRYRTGWTGTLKSSSINGLQVEGIFGPSKQIIETYELMDKGIVAQLQINVVRLGYPDDIRKSLKDKTYQDEMKFIEHSSRRTDMISKLIGSFNKTGLILCTKINHLKEYYKKVQSLYPSKNIYLIYGSNVLYNDVKYKTFEELKPIIENESDAILICSYGVFSTGISIKNLHWICFGSPTKSFIRTVQSIGRGLRVSSSKTKVTLIDIVDDLSIKRKRSIKSNYCMKHFEERFKIYMEQKFNYNIININL